MYCPGREKTITGISHREPRRSPPTLCGGRGEAIALLDKRIMRIISVLLVFAFIFSCGLIKDACAGRSNAGGGDLDEFNVGDVALNVGMSVGAAVAGQVVSSAWQAASPAVSATDMVFLEDMGYTMSKMDQILYSAKNIFTSTEPWVQGFNSLTSISNVAPNIISGFNTYAAASQVGRAAAMAGAYYEWDAPTKFLVSYVAVGATGGFLNPEIALGIKDVAPLSGYDMAKGAFVGGVGAGAKAAIIYTIDKDEFGAAGYTPSPGAQIAGLVGGVAATNFGRAVMDSDTYHPKPMFSAERAKSMDPRNFGGEFWAGVDGETAQRILEPYASIPQAQDDIGFWGSMDARGEVFKPSTQQGYQSQNTYLTPQYVDGKMQFEELFQTPLEATQFERNLISPDYKIQATGVPGVYEIIDRSAYVGADEALYRMFVKAPIIDTFSRISWPGLAAESAGILVKDSLKDAQWAQRWVAPLLTEFTRSGAQTVFSSVANIGGLGLDLYVGSQNDVNKARLQYDYAVRNKGFEHYMDEKMPEFKEEKVEEIMAKTRELVGLSRDLEYLKREMLSDEEITTYQEKEARRASLEQELGKDSITGKPFAILTSLNNKGEVINELNTQGAYLPTEKRRQLEDETTNLFNTNQNLVDLNRNLIITQEKMRVEKMMAVNEAGERISLTDALDVLGSKKGGVETSRPGLIFDQVIFGLRSDAFQSLTKVAASVMVADMVEPKNDSLLTNIFQPYLANMAAATIRGIAWHYGWDYNSSNWQWHTKDINMSRFDYPEPEKYDKGFGQQGFDFIRYKFDQANYEDDMARWDRFNEFNNFNKTDGVGLIYHEERQKYEFGKGNVQDPRWVSHIVFLEEKPSLAYAIGRSLEQANMDFLSGAFSFGRPFVRSSIADASIGIEPAQVSSASFMSYISNLQNISGKGLVSAIRSNILDPDTGAIVNSLSKTIGGTLLQVPYVPQIFHMQPERLVLTATLRAQKQPVRVVTIKEEARFAVHDISGRLIAADEIRPPEQVIETNQPSGAYGDGGFAGKQTTDTIGAYFKGAELEGPIGDPLIFGKEVIYEQIRKREVINKDNNGEPYYLSNEILKEKKYSPDGPADEPVLPYGPRVIPADYGASGADAGFSVFGGRTMQTERSYTIKVLEGTQTYYFLTDLKAMPSTIQSLRYGGGGIPHANYVFLDPFPNPFYQPKPQTGPMTYLKANSNSKPDVSSAPNISNSQFEGEDPGVPQVPKDILEQLNNKESALPAIEITPTPNDNFVTRAGYNHPQNPYNSSSVISSSMSDGANEKSGTVNVPAGLQNPTVPSFSANSITPGYYFVHPVEANEAGFTSRGSFVNPTGIAFVGSKESGHPTGTSMVTFTNGLDGIMWAVTGKPVTKYGNDIMPLFVSQEDRAGLTITEGPSTDLLGVKIPGANVAIGGFQTLVNNITYQNIAFLNENLEGWVSDGQKPSTKDDVKTPAEIVSFIYGATNISPKAAAIYVTPESPFAHFNYSSGAYIMPGDTIFGSGRQYIQGIGVSPETRNDEWLPLECRQFITGYSDEGPIPMYILNINHAGNISPLIATQVIPANTPSHKTEGAYNNVLPVENSNYLLQKRHIADINQLSTKESIDWGYRGIEKVSSPELLLLTKAIMLPIPLYKGDDIKPLARAEKGAHSEFRIIDKEARQVLEQYNAVGLLDIDNNGVVSDGQAVIYHPALSYMPRALPKAIESLKNLEVGVRITPTNDDNGGTYSHAKKQVSVTTKNIKNPDIYEEVFFHELTHAINKSELPPKELSVYVEDIASKLSPEDKSIFYARLDYLTNKYNKPFQENMDRLKKTHPDSAREIREGRGKDELFAFLSVAALGVGQSAGQLSSIADIPEINVYLAEKYGKYIDFRTPDYWPQAPLSNFTEAKQAGYQVLPVNQTQGGIFRQERMPNGEPFVLAYYNRLDSDAQGELRIFDGARIMVDADEDNPIFFQLFKFTKPHEVSTLPKRGLGFDSLNPEDLKGVFGDLRFLGKVYEHSPNVFEYARVNIDNTRYYSPITIDLSKVTHMADIWEQVGIDLANSASWLATKDLNAINAFLPNMPDAREKYKDAALEEIQGQPKEYSPIMLPGTFYLPVDIVLKRIENLDTGQRSEFETRFGFDSSKPDAHNNQIQYFTLSYAGVSGSENNYTLKEKEVQFDVDSGNFKPVYSRDK